MGAVRATDAWDSTLAKPPGVEWRCDRGCGMTGESLSLQNKVGLGLALMALVAVWLLR